LIGEPTSPVRETDFLRLEQISQQRIAEWDLTSRQRMLAGWIVRLSFGRGRESCLVPTLGHWRRLTGLDEADVCRAVQGLQEAGILQVSGPRRGPRRYTFLPNALLVEPDRVVDPEDAARCLAELEELNALGPGFEPGGQRRLEIVTTDERVDEKMAEASRELAVERQDVVEAQFGEAWTRRMMERQAKLYGEKRGEIGESPINRETLAAKGPETVKFAARKAGFGEIPEVRRREIGESPMRQPAVTPASAPACDVYVNDSTNNVKDVGCRPVSDEDVRFALETVRAAIPSSDFTPWSRKWESRCQLAPNIILEAVGDVKMMNQRQHVKCWGAAIFRRAQRLARERGITIS